MLNEGIIETMEWAFRFWQEKLLEIWGLVAETPENFKDGHIWDLAQSINGMLQSIGYALLVLFFAMSVFKSTANFQDFKRPEAALKILVQFAIAKAAITYGMDIMTAIFKICGGIVSNIASNMVTLTGGITLPDEIVEAIESANLIASIPLLLISFLGCIFVVAMSVTMILTVYGRFFRLYMYTALAPIPLATFVGEATSGTGKAFIKSYVGVCMEGAVIVLACLIYSAFMASGSPALVTSGSSAVMLVFAYMVELTLNMLILVGLVKGADRIVKEMLAL